MIIFVGSLLKFPILCPGDGAVSVGTDGGGGITEGGGSSGETSDRGVFSCAAMSCSQCEKAFQRSSCQC